MSGAKVLIVEDEFLVALQLEDILLDCGYEVLGAVPDFGSLAHIVGAPQVALVDVNLRDGLTGPDVARALSRSHGSRVIYVTANPNQIDVPADSAVGIIEKPFSHETIEAAVAYALADDLSVPRPAELLELPGYSLRRSA